MNDSYDRVMEWKEKHVLYIIYYYFLYIVSFCLFYRKLHTKTKLLLTQSLIDRWRIKDRNNR